jgi:hypothetical protein
MQPSMLPSCKFFPLEGKFVAEKLSQIRNGSLLCPSVPDVVKLFLRFRKSFARAKMNQRRNPSEQRHQKGLAEN